MNKQKVVVFQGGPVSSDLTFEELARRWEAGLSGLPEVADWEIFPASHLSPEQYWQKIGDCNAALGVWITGGLMKEEFLRQHPQLQYLSTLSHGFGEFDISMTKQYGLTVTNTFYGGQTIAQYAIALLLDICHNISAHASYTRDGYWKDKAVNPRAPFLKTFSSQIELYGKTFGVIGLGHIGFCAAKMAAGLGMKVIAYSRHPKVGPEYDFIRQVSLDELLAESDVISLHCPYSSENDRMINRESISKMKQGVILINTARGGLIDEDDLYQALMDRKIYMAGLDVLREEPPKEKIPLLNCPYAIVTAHIAWLPKESRLRAVDLAIENYAAWLHGHPQSVIN